MPDRSAADTSAASVFGEDFDAFYDAVEPHLAKMGRVASRLAGASERDDIVQEALCNAWRARYQFDPSRGSVSAWLLAITAHESTRLLRRARRTRRARVDSSEVTTRLGSDELTDLRDAITHLAPRERLSIECYYLAGLSVAETAAVMGCAEGTVKSTLSSGRARLREMLK